MEEGEAPACTSKTHGDEFAAQSGVPRNQLDLPVMAFRRVIERGQRGVEGLPKFRNIAGQHVEDDCQHQVSAPLAVQFAAPLGALVERSVPLLGTASPPVRTPQDEPVALDPSFLEAWGMHLHDRDAVACQPEFAALFSRRVQQSIQVSLNEGDALLPRELQAREPLPGSVVGGDRDCGQEGKNGGARPPARSGRRQRALPLPGRCASVACCAQKSKKLNQESGAARTWRSSLSAYPRASAATVLAR